MTNVSTEQVIIDLIRYSDGELCGKTRLFKAFYFAHLYYYRDNPGILTDCRIVRMPQGPGIDGHIGLLTQLVHDGLITIEDTHNGPYTEKRYRLTERGAVVQPLPDDAATAIKEAVEYVREKTAAELSALTHEYSRSWNQAKDGDTLNIYIDLIPDEEYIKRDADLNRLEERLKGLF